MSSHLHRAVPKVTFVALAIVSLLVAGCGRAVARTWHDRHDWNAAEYFDDPHVIELCRAIQASDSSEVERLIESGVDVNARGKDNMTPLLWAFPNKKFACFMQLLEHGADPDVNVDSDLNTKGAIRPGDSVTILSAGAPTSEQFAAVLKHGGDPNGTNPQSKETVISTVIQYAGDDAKARVQLLIDHGVNLNQLDETGTPPTIDAVSWFAQFDLALMMLDAGADPGAYMENQNYKLIHAVLTRKRGISRLSTEQQADYAKLVNWLVEHGENINEAQADLARWDSWHALPRSESKKRRQEEVAARKDREAKKPD